MSVRMKLSLHGAIVIVIWLSILLTIGPYCIEEITKDYGILMILSITFTDMGIQCFLIFGDICHISIRDMYGSPGGTFLVMTYDLFIITYYLLVFTYFLLLICYYLLLTC